MVKPKTYGRLGNFLFQVAAAAAYAWRHNLEFTVPDKTSDAKHNPIYLQHLVHPKWNPKLPQQIVEEKGFAWQEIPFREIWRDKNIILDGYWQSEKYFKHYRKRILDTFGFGYMKLDCVSVHVRRGDYLTIKKGDMFKHPPVPKEWLEKAMRQFPQWKFYFFSDDIAWCKKEFGDRDNCSFSENKTEIQDLETMSWCSHHICSASTFSWWGAWLDQNPDKRVIMPNHWLTPGWGGLDTKDVVPEEWERLSL